MELIYKYPLNGQRNIIQMPAKAKILTVQQQMGAANIWALVNTENISEERIFVVYGTGVQIINTEPLKYIGTIQENGGLLIWHVFEII